MEIEIIKKLIKKYTAGHTDFCLKADVADRYYRNKTDITIEETKKKEQKEKEPLRNADNRIPFNFHGLLVNQKAAYMFTAPPLFDLGSKKANKALVRLLGDGYTKTCKDLCVNASNTSIAWIHLWKNTEKKLEYAVVPSEQIIPVWDRGLKRKLNGVMRHYTETSEEDGSNIDIWEFWNEKVCSTYRVKNDGEDILIEAYPIYNVTDEDGVTSKSNEIQHEMGEIPFFPFFNNNIDTCDLDNIKPLIDVYCKVFSGFVNDLEDIQEVIFVLTNYGGQDLKEFMKDLKEYKAIKVDSDGDGDKSGVSTLTIELPVEAREKLLKITRKCIFEQGQGIDPDPENFGDSSGVALKFLYALLELKAGLMETEFRESFGKFIRCICRLQGISIKDDIIIQTWTRTSVKNESEEATIAATSKNIIPDEDIVRNHPWVENYDRSWEQLQKQKELENSEISDMFPKNKEQQEQSEQ